MSDPSPATAPRCPECGAPRANSDLTGCVRCGAAFTTEPEEAPPSPEALSRRARAWRVADRATGAVVLLGLAQRAMFYRHFSAGAGLALNLGATALSLAAWWAIHARLTPALTAWTALSVGGALASGAALAVWGPSPGLGALSYVSWVIGAAYAVSLTWARLAVSAR